MSKAIQDVSFEVHKGEVVGFLGPNGAGKTTTMRILTGCIGATSGRALIGGMDVMEHPREVKRKIGYLPEVPPLYGTMPVRDYVAFAALQFHWVELERVVRIEGRVERIDPAESDAYFASRPLASRIGAWASDQSRPLSSPAPLVAPAAELAQN